MNIVNEVLVYCLSKGEGSITMDKQKLVGAVIEEMKKDFYDNDWDAIDELLSKVDTKLLQGFLPTA
jgi:hypothetical protein